MTPMIPHKGAAACRLCVKKRPNEADAWWLVFDDLFDAFFKTLGIQTKL
jgi:hypothetical protein